MKPTMAAVLMMVAAGLGAAPIPDDDPKELGPVEFRGTIAKSENVSGLAFVGDFLVLGADEGRKVQILEKEGDHYKVRDDLEVVLGDCDAEFDIEGIARDGATVYVMGSHSAKREKVDKDNTYEQNLALIAKSARQPCRDVVFRFTLDAEGHASAVEKASLAPILDAHPILKRFRDTASKENGVDIEGVAFADGHLYAGFRGPVLRENFTPILKLRFGAPATDAELLFVDLKGLGVRDLARVPGGFLILAGPVGDGPGSYPLYFWDGRDCLPGKRASGQAGTLKPLGKIPAHDAKPEGIAVLKETGTGYECVVVYDGLKKGGATRFRVARP